MWLFLSELAGLLFEIIGSTLLLLEAIRFKFKDGHLYVRRDEKGFKKRRNLRRWGFAFFLIGFILQLFHVVGEFLLSE